MVNAEVRLAASKVARALRMNTSTNRARAILYMDPLCACALILHMLLMECPARVDLVDSASSRMDLECWSYMALRVLVLYKLFLCRLVLYSRVLYELVLYGIALYGIVLYRLVL
jgi:hypothetical protein